MANIDMDERNSFQTHIIYKDSDTFEVIRAATEILGMQFKKLMKSLNVFPRTFNDYLKKHLCQFMLHNKLSIKTHTCKYHEGLFIK